MLKRERVEAVGRRQSQIGGATLERTAGFGRIAEAIATLPAPTCGRARCACDSAGSVTADRERRLSSGSTWRSAFRRWDRSPCCPWPTRSRTTNQAMASLKAAVQHSTWASAQWARSGLWYVRSMKEQEEGAARGARARQRAGGGDGYGLSVSMPGSVRPRAGDRRAAAPAPGSGRILSSIRFIVPVRTSASRQRRSARCRAHFALFYSVSEGCGRWETAACNLHRL